MPKKRIKPFMINFGDPVMSLKEENLDPKDLLLRDFIAVAPPLGIHFRRKVSFHMSRLSTRRPVCRLITFH
jgi:hypothetical protein